MIRYRIEETINRPVHEVFPYVAEPALHQQWMPVSDVQVVPPGEVRVGSAVREMMKTGSRMAAFTLEVTAFAADKSVAFRTIEGPMNWEVTFQLEPVDGASTRITTQGRLGLKGWQRLMEPFIGGEIRRGEAAELRHLKDLLERPT